jgi:hypothetical protein
VNYRPFLIVLTLGLLVRGALMIAYFPSVMLWVDAIRHVRIAPNEIFGDPWMPAGYAIWLALLRLVTHQLWFTIAIQHVMGLGVGVMFFLVMRRLHSSSWLATGAAAVPLLSGDHLYLEHILMSDYFLIFLTMAGLTAAVFAFAGNRRAGWLCAASALLGLASLVRNVGIILVPLLGLCALLGNGKSLRARAVVVAAAILPALVVIVLYSGARVVTHGRYLGFSDMPGWDLYARVAPFADCRRFSPPPGTSILCESTPPSQRYGSLGYIWDESSIARRHFPLIPATQKVLGDFAWQAIMHQPESYISTVLIDLARYLDPLLDRRAYGGQSPEIISFGWRDISVERLIVKTLSKKYHKTKVHQHGQKLLAFYQNLFRLNGFLLAALFVLTCAGMIRARGSLRVGIFLFGLVAMGFYVVPVMTLSYDFRYGIPAETFLVISGLLGAITLRGQKTGETC